MGVAVLRLAPSLLRHHPATPAKILPIERIKPPKTATTVTKSLPFRQFQRSIRMSFRRPIHSSGSSKTRIASGTGRAYLFAFTSCWRELEGLNARPRRGERSSITVAKHSIEPHPCERIPSTPTFIPLISLVWIIVTTLLYFQPSRPAQTSSRNVLRSQRFCHSQNLGDTSGRIPRLRKC